MKFSRITNQVNDAVASANFNLPDDVYKLLREACDKETDPKAKTALNWIMENAAVAKISQIALCQDTGLPLVFIEINKSTKITGEFIDAIKLGVEQGYEKHCLRASLVDPLKRGKSTCKGAVVHVDFADTKEPVRITVLPKGFGSENKSTLKMFNPTASIEDIEDFIVESVKSAGPESCPPFVVGVGIGGTSDQALLLAKKALIDRLDKFSSDRQIHELEQRLLKKINALGIGPMGLGGNCTALAVKVKTAPTHIAGLPVGVNISCHALRRATVGVKP